MGSPQTIARCSGARAPRITASRHSDREAYERARRRAKARSAAITLAGQDIAPLPAVADPERRAAAEADFRIFCETYFRHLFALEWSADHLRVIEKIQRVVCRHETLAIGMPRGSGKTTLCLVAVLWAILSGRHQFVFAIAADQADAKMLLANIKQHLATNNLLAEDFPEAVYPIRCLEGETRRCKGQRYYGIPTRIEWGVEQVVLPTIPGSRCSGAIIRTSGITGNIRGALYVRPDGTQVRPTLIICDDPQTDASARSALQTAERLGIINGAIKGLAGPNQRTGIIVTCTVIQQGDLADQLLDRRRYPSWHGERTRLIYELPKNEKLWAEYARIRRAELAADGDGSQATAFYAEHRAAMDEGAVVAWPARYAPGELSAVQHAMNLKIDDEAAFWAEYQNEPLKPEHLGEGLVTVRQVMEKANGRKRGTVPASCTTVTMFIDVHDKLLYWCVCAWEEDFTGYVIDYGTLPEQPRRLFTMATATRTLRRKYPGAGADGAIRAGLRHLVETYLAKEWPWGKGLQRVQLLLVDAGYKPEIVASVKHEVGGATMMLYRGVGIRAAARPMSSYRRRPGERIGHFWYIPNVSRTAEFPHVQADVNYWKTFVHRALATPAGERGCLSLYGRPEMHELFAQHVAVENHAILPPVGQDGGAAGHLAKNYVHGMKIPGP